MCTRCEHDLDEWYRAYIPWSQNGKIYKLLFSARLHSHTHKFGSFATFSLCSFSLYSSYRIKLKRQNKHFNRLHTQIKTASEWVSGETKAKRTRKKNKHDDDDDDTILNERRRCDMMMMMVSVCMTQYGHITEMPKALK